MNSDGVHYLLWSIKVKSPSAVETNYIIISILDECNCCKSLEPLAGKLPTDTDKLLDFYYFTWSLSYTLSFYAGYFSTSRSVNFNTFYGVDISNLLW